ncbi:MAG TPA: molybdate ABC transporter substrate-binding protein [Candidatus Limnocylindrales bacterium]|nr:molybdate ABC transporter substrate-binding protein [Candidatus Limnocylindrales bacterium]
MRMPNHNPTRSSCGRLLFTLMKEGRRALFFSFFFFSSHIGAQTVRIAAASDLQFALPDLAIQYEKQTGVKLAVTYGSSGNLFAQIQNGAPFDIFLSADVDYPHRLVVAQLADVSSLKIYAVGQLILWLPPDSPLDPSMGLKILLDPRILKIAIANPEHAPYGRAAAAALHSAGVYGQVQPKLVFGENIAQAAQFVQTGSAQAGLLAYSLTSTPAMKFGKFWVVPADKYPAVEQAAILLSGSSSKQAATSFLAFLKTPMARSALERHGFFLPPAAPASKHKL